MLSALVGNVGSACLRRLGKTRASEVQFGRFLRNDKVTPAEMVQTAAAHTLLAAKGRHVLAIQDTTSLRDASNTTGQSLHMHPTIAVDADDGSLLGLVDATVLHRQGGTRTSRNRRDFNDKESRRWLDAIQSAAGLSTAGAACVTMVADREGDIYEDFALRPGEVDLVIRMRHDRVLVDGTMLSHSLDDVAELGRETIELPAHAGRKARRAVLSLRAKPVRLKAPKRIAGSPVPQDVPVWLVEARETAAPDAVDAVQWRLLTTHAVPTLAAALLITRFYRQRWTIEQVFRTMKTKGFDIEASRVEEGGPFENLSTAVLIAAIQVLQLLHDRDGAAGRPLTDVFDPVDNPAMAAINVSLEGATERQKNPHTPDTLAWASWICARLGGWNCYYGKPGPITIHRGLIQLRAQLLGWNLKRDV